MPPSARVHPDAVRFGAIVKRLRESRRWTLRELAPRVGLSPTYLGVLERGGNAPTLITILALIEVLGADVAEVMREVAEGRRRG